MKKMIHFIAKFKNKININFKGKIEYFNVNYLKHSIIFAVILNYLIESMSRHSIFAPIVYLVQRPVMFLFNVGILFFLLGIGCLFRKRVLYASIISIIIFGLGLANGILLTVRTTPLSVVDLTLLKSALLIVNLYISPMLLIVLILAIVVVILASVFLGLKAPKYVGKMYRVPVVALIVVSFFSLVGIDKILVNVGISTENYSNLANAYQNYGLPYCFSNSILKLGMKEPENYSLEKVEEIADEKLTDIFPVEVVIPDVEDLVNEPNKNAEVKGLINPNVIFVQLESFFDCTEVLGLELSKDPIANFRKLKKDFSSGYLYVPSVGAGTANTEFEVITGMNMDFFGPGEYPYKTILKTTTCESTAYDLKELGYATHAIHNNDGTFYDRHIVYSQLGFDTFTPIEYMYDKEINISGFAKDSMLVDEIINTLNTTKIQDYVFAVSVQAHGEYPTERLGEEEPIFIRYKDQSMENQWSYFVNQIYEVDQFIGDLIKELKKREEPTVLVFYGDHLPNLGLKNEDVSSNRLTATEYVVWNNMDLDIVDADVEAYQLTSHVLKMCDIKKGIMNEFHQNSIEDELYLENLELLQYDMLYGGHEIYGGINPYQATALKMGIRTIKITSVSQREDEVWISGNYFNPYSVVYYNGEKVDTVYMDKNALTVSGINVSEGDTFTVAQIGKDNYILGQTEVYLYSKQ